MTTDLRSAHGALCIFTALSKEMYVVVNFAEGLMMMMENAMESYVG